MNNEQIYTTCSCAGEYCTLFPLSTATTLHYYIAVICVALFAAELVVRGTM